MFIYGFNNIFINNCLIYLFLFLIFNNKIVLINKKEKTIFIFKKNKLCKYCNEVCHKICREKCKMEKCIITKENYEIIPQIPFYCDCGIKMKHIPNKIKKKK